MVEARQLLEGAVDTHVHSSPDLVERKLDDFELVRQARERVTAGTVLAVAASGLLTDDTDADSSALTAIKVSEPMHGSLTVTPGGDFISVPNRHAVEAP